MLNHSVEKISILEEVALEGIDDKDLVLVVGKGLRSEGGNVLGPTLLELLRRAVPPLNWELEWVFFL